MLTPLDSTDVFVSGRDGYHTFRIPVLLATASGAVLAFCEGRRDGLGDAGQIDLVLRRSPDGGRTWGPLQVVAHEPGLTSGNPAPVLDQGTGRVVLLFCRNPADGPENLICQGRAERTVWLTASRDEGRSWSPPRDITAQVKRPDWTWYATGPTHGIQLAGGRLLVPCDHIVGVHLRRAIDPHHAHVLLSDDGGDTWRIGGIAGGLTNESAAVELGDGRVYLNCRNYRRTCGCRATFRSDDGGRTFSDIDGDPALIEPVCQASLCHVDRPDGQRWILFANPAARSRTRLTVRLSRDQARTWPEDCLLHPGPAAYSDLAALPDGQVLCLYECGQRSAHEVLRLARLRLG